MIHRLSDMQLSKGPETHRLRVTVVVDEVGESRRPLIAKWLVITVVKYSRLLRGQFETEAFSRAVLPYESSIQFSTVCKIESWRSQPPLSQLHVSSDPSRLGPEALAPDYKAPGAQAAVLWPRFPE